jgi:hypothetical protein
VLKRTIAICLTLLAALPLMARDDCNPAFAGLAVLYDIRNAMLTSSSEYDVRERIDKRIDDLRDPLPEGGYRWVHYARPSGEPPTITKGHSVVASQEDRNPDVFEASGAHVFAVRVVVPRKRSLFKGNNRVYVGGVRIRYDVEGRSRSQSKPINRWMEPDTSQTFDLDTIANHVDVSIDAATAPNDSRESLVEIQLRQAVAQDDVDNPAYPAIRALQRVRATTEPRVIDDEIATLEHSVFPSSSSLPVTTVIDMLRRGHKLLESSKEEEQEKGRKMIREALRSLR